MMPSNADRQHQLSFIPPHRGSLVQAPSIVQWRIAMTGKRLALAATAVLALAGCQTPNQTLDAESTAATQSALTRGRFEMSCPTAEATVLSRNLINPVLNGPMMNGVQRAEYTIGISGCGQKATYIAVCQIGSVSCITAAGRNAIQ
jgi:hypothetical protein